MKYLQFNNQDKLPIIGLGTWKSAPGEVYNAVLEAIKIGYRHIDCAFIYRNEKEIGDALEEAFSSNLVQRNELFITSKLWNNSHESDKVEGALLTTLKDLKIEYIDLYLMHWPVVFKNNLLDPESSNDLLTLEDVPLLETWLAMEKLVNKGLVKHIGVSNFNIPKLQNLIDHANIKPEMNQVEIHPFHSQTDLVDFCQANDILMTAYAPLGSNDRSAAIKGKNEKSLLENDTIINIAQKIKATPAQVLLAWQIKRNIAVIPKSVHANRLKENLNAQSIILSQEDFDEINSLNINERYIHGEFWSFEGKGYTADDIWNK
ncbi:aldo/keto reductase [Aureibacter tunicatorum]|uniref:Alcohol dehydrogenase (NADP+) n=1 Tax=Aureibacter tunicatorum TaxID=866807 RepID=A0AAE3XM16_9BACT|nr:aldo/keto reductase [Aureibacter tunicatorum]MDR6238425.1 alcohol dehydrogenase (NADP+) [Aureibacter tunicatorum]BDD03457.1 aldehyde reductase [Aureibacter tunicatorum]